MKIKLLKANCFEIQIKHIKILVSYETPIAVSNGQEILMIGEKISKTTEKHEDIWLKWLEPSEQKKTYVSREVLSVWIESNVGLI